MRFSVSPIQLCNLEYRLHLDGLLQLQASFNMHLEAEKLEPFLI